MAENLNLEEAKPISLLPDAQTLQGNELFPVVQDKETRKATIEFIAAFILSELEASIGDLLNVDFSAFAKRAESNVFTAKNTFSNSYSGMFFKNSGNSNGETRFQVVNNVPSALEQIASIFIENLQAGLIDNRNYGFISEKVNTSNYRFNMHLGKNDAVDVITRKFLFEGDVLNIDFIFRNLGNAAETIAFISDMLTIGTQADGFDQVAKAAKQLRIDLTNYTNDFVQINGRNGMVLAAFDGNLNLFANDGSIVFGPGTGQHVRYSTEPIPDQMSSLSLVHKKYVDDQLNLIKAANGGIVRRNTFADLAALDVSNTTAYPNDTLAVVMQEEKGGWYYLRRAVNVSNGGTDTINFNQIRDASGTHMWYRVTIFGTGTGGSGKIFKLNSIAELQALNVTNATTYPQNSVFIVTDVVYPGFFYLDRNNTEETTTETTYYSKVRDQSNLHTFFRLVDSYVLHLLSQAGGGGGGGSDPGVQPTIMSETTLTCDTVELNATAAVTYRVINLTSNNSSQVIESVTGLREKCEYILLPAPGKTFTIRHNSVQKCGGGIELELNGSNGDFTKMMKRGSVVYFYGGETF